MPRTPLEAPWVTPKYSELTPDLHRSTTRIVSLRRTVRHASGGWVKQAMNESSCWYITQIDVKWVMQEMDELWGLWMSGYIKVMNESCRRGMDQQVMNLPNWWWAGQTGDGLTRLVRNGSKNGEKSLDGDGWISEVLGESSSRSVSRRVVSWLLWWSVSQPDQWVLCWSKGQGGDRWVR